MGIWSSVDRYCAYRCWGCYGLKYAPFWGSLSLSLPNWTVFFFKLFILGRIIHVVIVFLFVCFFLENKNDENYTNKKVSNKLALVSHAMNINFQSLSERNAPALKAIPPSIPSGTLERI